MKRFLFCLLIIFLTFTACASIQTKEERLAEEKRLAEEHYLENVESFYNLAQLTYDLVDSMTSLYRTAWYDAIWNSPVEIEGVEYYDFQEAIWAMERYMISQDYFSLIDNGMDDLSEKLRALRNPPSRYQELYEECTQLYSYLLDYVDFLEDYVGYTLTTYTDTRNSLRSAVSGSLNRVKVLKLR